MGEIKKKERSVALAKRQAERQAEEEERRAKRQQRQSGAAKQVRAGHPGRVHGCANSYLLDSCAIRLQAQALRLLCAPKKAGNSFARCPPGLPTDSLCLLHSTRAPLAMHTRMAWDRALPLHPRSHPACSTARFATGLRPCVHLCVCSIPSYAPLPIPQAPLQPAQGSVDPDLLAAAAERRMNVGADSGPLPTLFTGINVGTWPASSALDTV